ncbi:acid-activated periplasmic chaperone HdeA [Methylocystis sp.]|uniref:acid-activated periplasmic chaperone HdeA n=1 Tax=Methylocystis sp. TaxID=1911079 RepID=UPI003DA3FC28
MKPVYFIAAAALSFYATNGLAEAKKPTSKWTCEDFLAVDDQFQPKVIYWSSAQSKKGKPLATDVDIEGTEKVIPMVIDDCKKAPQESFWSKLKGAWKKVETDAKSLGKKL